MRVEDKGWGINYYYEQHKGKEVFVGKTKGRIFLAFRDEIFGIFKGFGISKEILEDLIKRNCKEIRVVFTDKRKHTQMVCKVSPLRWKSAGNPYKHPDYEEQMILPINKFSEVLE